MQKDDSLKNFQELLKLRSILKKISQITWNINVLEKRYPLESLSEEEIIELIGTYNQYLGQLKEALEK